MRADTTRRRGRELAQEDRDTHRCVPLFLQCWSRKRRLRVALPTAKHATHVAQAVFALALKVIERVFGLIFGPLCKLLAARDFVGELINGVIYLILRLLFGTAKHAALAPLLVGILAHAAPLLAPVLLIGILAHAAALLAALLLVGILAHAAPLLAPVLLIGILAILAALLLVGILTILAALLLVGILTILVTLLLVGILAVLTTLAVVLIGH